MVKSRSLGSILFNIFNYTFLALLTLFCLFPFWLMIVASLTEKSALDMNGYLPWTQAWTAEAYRWVLGGAGIQTGYRVSLFVTIVGTVTSVIVMSALGYAISLKRFNLRNVIAFYLFYTTIFGGGLIPFVLVCQKLGLYDNLAALIVPMLVAPFWVLVLRNFFKGLPEEIIESARIDGASEFTILFQIVLPLSLPALATVGLFMAVAYWNDFFLGVMLLREAPYRPLAVWIYRMLNSLQAIQQAAKIPGVTINANALPTHALRMATAAVTIGPIILLYPFVQRYFIRGLTLGGVKG